LFREFLHLMTEPPSTSAPSTQSATTANAGAKALELRIAAAMSKLSSHVPETPKHQLRASLQLRSPLSQAIASPQQSVDNRCRPWSREDYLGRLKTFKAALWFAKPVQLSALEVARHGWINIGPDLLECTVCRAVLAARISPELVRANMDAVVADLHSKLQSAHKPLCAWKDNPAAVSALMDFVQRVASFGYGRCRRRCGLFQAHRTRTSIILHGWMA
jgi:hypothetical protein